jgi:hypothetical protein
MPTKKHRVAVILDDGEYERVRVMAGRAAMSGWIRERILGVVNGEADGEDVRGVAGGTVAAKKPALESGEGRSDGGHARRWDRKSKRADDEANTRACAESERAERPDDSIENTAPSISEDVGRASGGRRGKRVSAEEQEILATVARRCGHEVGCSCMACSGMYRFLLAQRK